MVAISFLKQLYAFIKKEFKQLRRNKVFLRIIIIAPVLQVLILSYVVRTEVKEINFKVIDRSASQLTRNLIAELDASPYLEFQGILGSERDIYRDRAQIFIIFPEDFLDENAVVIVDGSDPGVAQQALFYSTSLLLHRGFNPEPASTILYNPGLKSSDYMVPAIIGVVIVLMGALITSMSIVREEEIGTLEQLNVTPIKKWQLIAGKIIPYFSVLTVEVVAVEILAVHWFEVPLRGSIWLVLLASLLLLIIALSIGVAVSAMSSTQHQALTASFFIFLQAILLSGLIFPIQSMPQAVQLLTYLIPLRYYLEIIRSVFLKRTGFTFLYPRFAALMLMALVLFVFAAGRVRKVSRLEAAVVVRGLTKRFGHFTAVDNISFDVYRGEVFGFLGPNGAGKSTTIRMLTGLLVPTSGRAFVNDIDVVSHPEKVKSSIGYMSQLFSLCRDLTVKENLEFFGGLYGIESKELNREIESMAVELRFKDYLNVLADELPAGIHQRVAFAGALLHCPAVVFLDEPTAGVDPAFRKEFWNILLELAREGTTFFITTHQMEEAERCTRVAFISGGRILADGSPSQVKERSGIAVMEIETAAPEELRRELADLVEAATIRKKSLRIVYKLEQEKHIDAILNNCKIKTQLKHSRAGLNQNLRMCFYI